MQGRFITVEGGEGVGKSTNMDFVCQHLADAGIDVLVTRDGNEILSRDAPKTITEIESVMRG